MSEKLHIAFAAGSGIATVLPEIKNVLAADPSARVLLFYSNDTLAQVPLLEELQALKNQHLGRLSLNFFFSSDPQEVELFNGALNAEKVRALAGAFFDPAQVHEFLVGGLDGAAGEVVGALNGLGVPGQKIRGRKDDVPLPTAGTLTPSSSPASGGGEETRTEEDTEVTVIMDGRRRSFVMNRAVGDSVLNAAEEAGFDLPFSCRAGVCSTCRTKVVKGAVEMLQNYALEPWELEQGYVLACQSYPTTPELELDYDDK